jgi:hypothetical protein
MVGSRYVTIPVLVILVAVLAMAGCHKPDLPKQPPRLSRNAESFTHNR